MKTHFLWEQYNAANAHAPAYSPSNVIDLEKSSRRKPWLTHHPKPGFHSKVSLFSCTGTWL